MDIFGLRITRIRKAEKMELERFSKTVHHLDVHISRMIDIVCNRVDLNNRDIPIMVSRELQTIDSLFNVYMHNRFSSPGVNLNVHDYLNQMHKVTHVFCTVFVRLVELKSVENNNPSIDRENFDKDVSESIRLLGKSGMFLETTLKALSFVIVKDLIKLDMGVDIIDEYRRNQKEIKRYGPKASEFAYVVRFNKLNKKGEKKT